MNNADRTTPPAEGRRFPRLIFLLIPIGAVLIVAALWRFTPLSEIAGPEKLQALIEARWTHQWWTVLLVIAVYLIANLLMFPNSILNIAVILGMGGIMGWLYAIGGSLSAATVFFFVGHFWGVERLKTLNYAGLPTIRRFMAKGGIAAVVAVHSVPSAPYAVVNSVIGTFNIRYRDFVVGTFLGHLPGTLCLAIFGTQLKTLLKDPSPRNLGLVLLMACVAAALIVVLRRKLKTPGVSEPELATAELRV